MKTCRAFSVRKPLFSNVSEHISDSTKGICLLIAAGDSDNSVMNIDGAYTWVQIPCAVDSGACAYASPPGIFGKMPDGYIPKKDKYFGADGTPIDELGQMSVNAILDEGTEMQASLDIAKISRLLLSVNQMVVHGHQVIFGKDESYIQLSGCRRKKTSSS